MDLLHWRRTDLRLAKQEEEVYKGNWLERDREIKKKVLKRCIARLAKVVKPIAPETPEPSIRLLPSGHKNSKADALKQIRGYQLEGMDMGDLDRESTKQHEVEDPEDLHYLCDKVADAEFKAEMQNVWALCDEICLDRACKSTRKHAYRF
jgi:hypothetical protein